jgi:transcription elongation factor Elf1
MPDPQTPALSPRAAARPRCPKCQSRMEVQHIIGAQSGFEHWTLRCIKCGLIHEAQINVGPRMSDGIWWEHSDVRAPQQGR